jgi:quercetin dioxygenase-like cupin family protein
VDVEFPAGATVAFEAQRLAELDQHIFILEGRMELTLGGTTHRLETGDCLHMRLDQPVVFRNPAKKAARYIVVLCRGAPKP